MATAVEPGSQPQTPTPSLGLPVASLIGAAYVAAAIAVAFYVVPAVWAETVAPALAGVGFVEVLARVVVQLAAVGAMLWFGRLLLGAAPIKGVRGGTFLVLVTAAAIFFIWRAVATTFETGIGLTVGTVVALFLVVLAGKVLTGETGTGWMVALEEQGWFSTAGYKKSLGSRARRLTILGFLILGGTGIYSLASQSVLPNDWAVALPFENPSAVTLIPDAQYAVPVILLVLTLWFAWRAVNVPTFAEFLIATEAEMNKVSWSTRKRLAQDTVVVLTTTLLMALFLLVVDLFWGWLLSREIVGVLPGKSGTEKDKSGKVERARW
ncbi:preprotein translocase subunit SecE [Gemmata sp.]|uniref:preprotein translocase subunit SecE n=1 Tax=Gemmata sp. TaxID=1914242 RepID=UPI003F6F309C